MSVGVRVHTCMYSVCMQLCCVYVCIYTLSHDVYTHYAYVNIILYHNIQRKTSTNRGIPSLKQIEQSVGK